ncbi:MAG TPA: STAS domain-containing protein [Candidatus Acidoferrales bacterium]|nr:STAS domain-containing protein [Candidatus Acidoferrales bacterium]
MTPSLFRRAPGLVVSVSTEGSASAVTRRGEADVGTLPAIKDAPELGIATDVAPVIVHPSETRFTDSAAIRALVEAGRELEHRSRRLTVRVPSRAVIRILKLLGSSRLILTGEEGSATEIELRGKS